MNRSARCLKRRLIEEAEGRPHPHLDNERMRCYRISKLGRKMAQAEAARMSKWEASRVYVWNHKTCLMIHAQFDFTGG
jgi:hypothetical protein